MDSQNSAEMRCDLCNLILKEENWKSHCAGKRHKRAIHESQRNSELERTVYIKGAHPCADPQDFAQFLESKVGKVLKCNIFPGFSLVEFENRSHAEEILKMRLYYCGSKLLIKPKRRREAENVEPEGEIDYDKVQEVLETSNTMNNDFEDQLSILLEQVVVNDPEHENKINLLCRTLEELFHSVFPGCIATAFGSAVTGLFFVGSDIDIVLWAPGSLKAVHSAGDLAQLGKRLMFSRQNQFSKVISIPRAKTPIIKFVHIPTRTKCDVSFHNIYSVQNSRLLAFIISSDERIRKMMLFVKFWAQRHSITLNIRISNYTIALLAIFYLQQGKDPLLPAIVDLRDPQAPVPVNNWDTNFQVNTKYQFNSSNKESTENLVAGFFRFYAEVDWANVVVCPLLGLLIPRDSFLPENLDNLPAGLAVYKTVTSSGAKPLAITSICVQDPFELNHNVAHTVCDKVEHFHNLFKAIVGLLLDGPDGAQLPPLSKLLTKDLCPIIPKKKSVTQDFLTMVMNAKHYLKEEYLGSFSIDDNAFSRWANIVINFIEVVLQNILKFEVTREKPLGFKVQKTDSLDNVHSQQFVLNCYGTHGVYHSRKKINKIVQGQHTWFEQLARVSEKIIATNQAASMDLKFRCIMKADEENCSLIVKFELLNDSVHFAPVTTYLSQVLFKWTDKALRCGLALKYSTCNDIETVKTEVSHPGANVVNLK